MKLTVKDAINMLECMNPESIIYVGGGHIDYVTDDVVFIEENGHVTVQESNRVKAERYHIVDVPNDVSAAYDKLIIYRSYMASLSESLRLFDSSFSGTVIIDALCSLGNNRNRMLSVRVINGKGDPSSVQMVETARKSPIRVFSCMHLRNDPQAIENSVLTKPQKQLLLKGITL